jgi:hypothetical protein
MIIDLFLVYQFLKRLTTPFQDWPAYAQGIIDADGNLLKKRRDLKTVKERDAFGIFDLMILKLKKLLAKVPGGQSRIATYAAALWLIKEHDQIIMNGDYITEEYIEESLNHYIHYTKETYDVNSKFESMIEDIANNAGSGNIDGIGVGPRGEPGVSRRVQRKILKRNTEINTNDIN